MPAKHYGTFTNTKESFELTPLTKSVDVKKNHLPAMFKACLSHLTWTISPAILLNHSLVESHSTEDLMNLADKPPEFNEKLKTNLIEKLQLEVKTKKLPTALETSRARFKIQEEEYYQAMQTAIESTLKEAITSTYAPSP
jgi:hypothetical protein